MLSSPAVDITSRSEETTSTCTTAAPGPHGQVPPDACNSYYSYNPIFEANIAFAVLFALLTIIHAGQAVWHKKRFCWTLIVGASWEFLAFATYAAGSKNQQNLGLAIVSPVLLTLAPLWTNAFVYMCTGRLIFAFLPAQKVWKIKAISIQNYFLWVDVACFVLQFLGAIMLNPSNNIDIIEIGTGIYMTGTAIQLLFIILFFAILVTFHTQMNQLVALNLGPLDSRWLWLTSAVYFALVTISIRILFRLAQYSRGLGPETNKVLSSQAYMLGFDALPMLLGIASLNIIHPGIVLRGAANNFPTRKEKKLLRKEARIEKKVAKVAPMLTDPCESDANSFTESQRHEVAAGPIYPITPYAESSMHNPWSDEGRKMT